MAKTVQLYRGRNFRSVQSRPRFGALGDGSSAGGSSGGGTGNALSSAIGAGAGLVKSKNPVTNYAAQGAAAGSAFGPIGTVIGAAVGAIGGAFMGSKRPESEIWDKYKAMAGNAAGHEYDNQFRNEAFVGLMRLQKNTFPPRLKLYSSTDDKKFLSDMVTLIADAFRSGKLSVSDASTEAIWSKAVKPWLDSMGTEKSAEWARWENQIVKDQIDAWLYDQPIIATSYTQSTWPQPRVTALAQEILSQGQVPAGAVPAPVPAPASPAQGSAATPPATASPSPAPVPVPQIGVNPPTVTSATDPNLQAYIQALLDQGASQQQAFQAALAAVGNSGTAVTPAVQQAVADQVTTAGVGAGLPSWLLYVAGGAAVLFALARPADRSGRRKRR